MISVEHVTKYYDGVMAVHDLTFEIDEGRVYGFLGPNGAGKSTTMNIMTGCLSATTGTVRIDGYDIFEQPQLAKKLIGYLPEQPPLYMNESPLEYLQFVGEAKGLRGAELRSQIREVIHQVGLEAVRHRRIAELSKGYKQRVGIAQALLGKPKVIILDEPTVGLDPLQIMEIRDLIRELGQNHTVILSSHILSEVQTICDEILMIADGKLVAFDTPANLEKQLRAGGEIHLVADTDVLSLKRVLAAIADVMDYRMDTHSAGYAVAYIQTDKENIYTASGDIFRACAAQNIVLLEMAVKKGSLEEIFLELAENGSHISAKDAGGTEKSDDGEDRKL